METGSATRAMSAVQFPPTALTADEEAFKSEVGTYLDRRIPAGSFEPSLGIAARVDPQFSRDLGAEGYIGMYLPSSYGGSDRTGVDRLIVAEELLARGAPVGYHWIADRQSGPSIFANGTEQQRQEFLPGISAGRLSFAIGMSEPDAGSDLAAMRTKAVPSGDEWIVNGTKVWTTGADTATQILTALRTSEDRRGGITQFIIDSDAPGVTVSPIEFIDGSREFCEVAFDDVRVPDTRRLGPVGAGWSQNTGELALERGGVDRWMSLVPVIREWARRSGKQPSEHRAIGRLGSMCWALRGLSLAIARQVDRGHSPVVEAALVKEMATTFEQESLRTIADSFGRLPRMDSTDEFESLLARALLIAPSWTIRGGTNEVLRNIVAKGIRS